MTPSPTATTDLQSIFSGIALLISGQGVSEAAEYSPSAIGPHKIILVDDSGLPHDWNYQLPADWLPASIGELKLVAVLTEIETIVARQDYFGGPPVTRYRHDLNIKIYEARTGKFVTEETFKGGEPAPFPQSAIKELKRIDGLPVQYFSIDDWLVIPVCSSTLFGHEGPITKVLFPPDGSILATASDDLSIRLWNWRDGKLLFELVGNDNPIKGLFFSPDGAKLVSWTAKATVTVWNTTNGQKLSQIKFDAMNTRAFAIAPDGAILASGSTDGTISLWNIQDGMLLRTLKGHTNSVDQLAFSSDGKLLASGSLDYTIRIWLVTDGTLLHSLAGHESFITGLFFSPDNLLLASGSEDKTARIWRVKEGDLVHALEGHRHSVYQPIFSSDSKMLVTRSYEEVLRLWDVENGSLLKSMSSGNVIMGALISPDNETIVTHTNDKNLYIWNKTSGELVFTLTGHAKDVTSFAISQDAYYLASGSEDKTVRIWYLQDILQNKLVQP